MTERAREERSLTADEYANSVILGRFGTLKEKAPIFANISYAEKTQWHEEGEARHSVNYIPRAHGRSSEQLLIKHTDKVYLDSIPPALIPYGLYDKIFDYGYNPSDDVQIACSSVYQYTKNSATIRRRYKVSSHLIMGDASEEIGLIVVNGTVVPGLPRKGEFMSFADSVNILDENDIQRVKQAVAWLLAT